MILRIHASLFALAALAACTRESPPPPSTTHVDAPVASVPAPISPPPVLPPLPPIAQHPPMCEVEIFGHVKGASSTAPPTILVSDGDCLAAGAHILGALSASKTGTFSIEVFAAWGSDVTICAAAVTADGKPSTSYGKASGVFHAEKIGEVVFQDVAIELKPGPAKTFARAGTAGMPSAGLPHGTPLAAEVCHAMARPDPRVAPDGFRPTRGAFFADGTQGAWADPMPSRAVPHFLRVVRSVALVSSAAACSGGASGPRPGDVASTAGGSDAGGAHGAGAGPGGPGFGGFSGSVGPGFGGASGSSGGPGAFGGFVGAGSPGFGGMGSVGPGFGGTNGGSGGPGAFGGFMGAGGPGFGGTNGSSGGPGAFGGFMGAGGPGFGGTTGASGGPGGFSGGPGFGGAAGKTGGTGGTGGAGGTPPGGASGAGGSG